MNKITWSPDSWINQPIIQQPIYPNKAAVATVVRKIQDLPPLVTHLEVDALRLALIQAQQGHSFLLQGGDCAESFADCRADNIANNLKMLLQMSLILLDGIKKPIIRVGRVAGQYAKPRSADTEIRDGVSLPSYRGDLINQPDFTSKARTPHPDNMLKGYYYSSATLNYLRALAHDGFADLHHPEYWQLDYMAHTPYSAEYQKMASNTARSVMDNVLNRNEDKLHYIDMYTSHEALLLPYEQALTRYIDEKNQWYNLSTHFPWIGMRTSQLNGAHIEYMRGIANPIALKVGPQTTTDDLLALIETLNPENELGKLSLVHRMGSQLIQDNLLPLIEAVKAEGLHVLWVCDPMHGNTQITQNQIKTRRFEDILQELKYAFMIHRQAGTHLGGVHLELTGDNVTECTGGSSGLTEADLHFAYKSPVDPRLNYEQALEIARFIAKI